MTQACLNAWLAGVQRVGARPEIAFKPDPNYRSPNGAFVGAPDIHTYRVAIEAFTSGRRHRLVGLCGGGFRR